jgi:Lon protease-like protein
MIMPPTTAGGRSSGNDFGTMLEIKSIRMLRDGRSMVETRGTYRFRIMERGTFDGYMVARIERCSFHPFSMVVLCF